MARAFAIHEFHDRTGYDDRAGQEGEQQCHTILQKCIQFNKQLDRSTRVANSSAGMPGPAADLPRLCILDDVGDDADEYPEAGYGNNQRRDECGPEQPEVHHGSEFLHGEPVFNVPMDMEMVPRPIKNNPTDFGEALTTL